MLSTLHSQHDALVSMGNSIIAVPKRATVADLVSSVVAAAAAQRETSSLSLVNATSRSRTSTAAELPPEVVAKFPSHQGLWSVLRRAIAADPVGTQEPPLFLLRDSVTRDALTINQQYLKSLIESFEANGGGTAIGSGPRRAARRDPNDDNQHYGGVEEGGEENNLVELYHNNDDEDDGDSATVAARNDDDEFALTNGNSFGGGSLSRATRSSFDIHRTPQTGSFARGLNDSALSTPTLLGAGGGGGAIQTRRGAASQQHPKRSEPKSSLVTVTVTSATGLLRTFRASVQFWEHVLLQYHHILESHRRWPPRNSNHNDTGAGGSESAGGPRAAAAAAQRDVAASNTLTAEQLLRKAKQQEDDRVVLTVKVSSTGVNRHGGDGAQDASRSVVPPPAWWMKTARRAQTETLSETAGVVAEGDVELLSSLQVTVKEWRQVVEEWDRTTEPLVLSSRRLLPSSSLKQRGDERSPRRRAATADTIDVGNPTKTLSAAEGADVVSREEGSRPRRAAIIDPSTSGDLVDDARRRMHEMEAQSVGTHSAFWTHFMKHWRVLEAQYRNYL